MRGSSRDPRRVVRRQGWTFDPDAYEGARYPDPTLGFAFDPTTRAGLWQDGSGQQDRPITARWYQSDADQSAGPLEPPIVAFDPATAGAGMWPEQPAEWRPTTWPQPD